MSFSIYYYFFLFYYYRKSLTESLHAHVVKGHTHTVKKLVSFHQVDVNYCLNGKTPIMVVGSEDSSDEKCSELYDALIQAGALNYCKSDELWYDLFSSQYFIDT